MDNLTFKLKFLFLSDSPEEFEVSQVSFTDRANSFAVLKNHAPLVAALGTPCTVSYTMGEAIQEKILPDGGIVHVTENDVLVLG